MGMMRVTKKRNKENKMMIVIAVNIIEITTTKMKMIIMKVKGKQINHKINKKMIAKREIAMKETEMTNRVKIATIKVKHRPTTITTKEDDI